MNGRAVSAGNMHELKALMREQAGMLIEITALRNGQPIEVELKLRRMV